MKYESKIQLICTKNTMSYRIVTLKYFVPLNYNDLYYVPFT